MLQLKNISVRFGGLTALDNVTFAVGTHDVVGLVGPNGAGKTTFLRILSTLSRPSMGLVKVAGFLLPAHSASVRQRLGVVSHMPLLYGDLTAEENLQFYGRMYNIPVLKERIDVVLALIGLSGRRRDMVRTFSRGMQQRLAIGRAVLHNPDVMLFDEPYTGLDQDASEMLDDVLKNVAAAGRTVVMTSHDLARAEELGTRFDILTRGVISASCTREELGSDNLLTFYKQALIG